MKKVFLMIATLSISYGIVNANNKKKEKNKTDISKMVQTKNDSLVYALGQSVSANLHPFMESEGIISKNTDAKKQNEINLDAFKKGFKSAIDSLDSSEKAYVLGASIGQNLFNMLPQFKKEVLGEGDIDKDLLIAAFYEGLDGTQPLIPNAQNLIEKQILSRQNENKEIKERELNENREKKIAEEQKFLSENMKKEGIIALPNGLQYKIIKEGKGAKPSIDSNVTVHYEGRLLDGTVFDSSIQRGQPTSFPLTSVIKGWTEILQLMPVGSKWTVYIPQELAYGSAEIGTIPPFSTLEFDIELISID